jgi:hypothetical protein
LVFVFFFFFPNESRYDSSRRQSRENMSLSQRGSRADGARSAVNTRAASGARVILSGVLAGTLAGTLGLTGVRGVLLYVAFHAATLAAVVAAALSSSSGGGGGVSGNLRSVQGGRVFRSSSSASSSSSSSSPLLSGLAMLVAGLVGGDGGAAVHRLRHFFPRASSLGAVDTTAHQSQLVTQALLKEDGETLFGACGSLLWDWLTDAGLTFVLFWALFYNIVHVY